MITIMISEDEKKARESIISLLQQQGYDLPDSLTEHTEIVRISKKNETEKPSSIDEMVVELEDSLYKNNVGTLYRVIVRAIERPLLEHTLRRTEGNQLKAARILGLNRNTMRTKIKKLGIDANRWKARV